MKSLIEKHRSRISWCVFFIFCGLNVLVYQRPIADIIEQVIWDADLSYVLLVPFLAIYLIWLRRSRLRCIKFRVSIWGPAIILLGWVGFLIGGVNEVVFLWHLGFLIGFLGITVTFLGSRILAPFFPAIIVVLSIVPIPGSIRLAVAQPLQRFATSVTASILDTVGVPAIQAGNLIEINGATVAIGEACNGMRLLVPLALVIFTFVFSLPLRASMRSLLLVASIPIALICNVLRLVPSALAYGYFPSIAEPIHDIGGWLMIPLALFFLIGLLRLIEWLDIPVTRWRLATA